MSSAQSFAVDVQPLDDGRVEVRVQGELDMSTAPTLAAALKGAADDPAVVVLLDLSKVTFVDSTTISTLITTGQELATNGQRLQIGPRSSIVSRVLEIAGVLEPSDAFDVLPLED